MPRRSSSSSPAGLRLAALPLALPAGKLTAALAAGILAVSCLAGALRLLPVLLSAGAPIDLAPLLARGVLGVALETALFVAPPIAWALASARLVDRGEARALLALGVRPARLLAGTWPAALAVALASGLAVASWGREASAPGKLVRELVAASRAACVRRADRGAADLPLGAVVAEVPLLGVAWVCFPGAPPWVVGSPSPGEAGSAPAFAAASIAVSDDLRLLDATSLRVAFRPGSPQGGPLVLRAAQASVRGLTPVGRASNLSPTVRVAVLTGSALANAFFAATLVLLGPVRSRTAALVLGACGPATGLLFFAALERAPASVASYAAIPAAGLAVTAFARSLLARRALAP